MSRFDYTIREKVNPRDRFAESAGDFPVRGQNAWRVLWDLVVQLSEGFFVGLTNQEQFEDALQDFLELAPTEPGPPLKGAPCCVFISHRRADVDYAERIAYLAAQQGFQYWLDVHDPLLAGVTNAALPSPAQEVLTAAIIEIALLNSTHVIAVHTQNSDGSKWIPYEVGRAKQRRVLSSRACGWFDVSGTPPSAPVAGEYMFLAARTESDDEVDGWLYNQKVRARVEGKHYFLSPYWTKGAVPGALPG